MSNIFQKLELQALETKLLQELKRVENGLWKQKKYVV